MSSSDRYIVINKNKYVIVMFHKDIYVMTCHEDAFDDIFLLLLGHEMQKKDVIESPEIRTHS